MEEFIAVGLQIFFEFGVAMLASPGLDVAGSRTESQKDGCGWILLHVVFGGGLGYLSALIFPGLILPNMGLRIAYLVLAPIAAGAISAAIAKYLKKNSKKSFDPGNAFLHAMLFAGMFGAARFAFGER